MKFAQWTRLSLCIALAATCSLGFAQKKYDDGASDTEILIGNIVPYSGPASGYGFVGKALTSYFDMINEKGGINGRKVRILSVDDGYNPAKTVEQARKLIEQDKVLLMAGNVGTATNMAIQRYVNQKKVPHLLVGSGASRWNDPKNFPWTMGWIPSYKVEGEIYAKHILDAQPKAKVAILYQNDDFGTDYLTGFKSGLGARAKDIIVAEAGVNATDPTVDSQIVSLKASGADTILYFVPVKQAAQAIKKVGELGWKPAQYVSNVSTSIEKVIKPAGIENAKGMMSLQYLKEPSDPRWAGTPELKAWQEWMKKYNPTYSLTDNLGVYGYSQAQVLEQILRQAGDNLTRENIMKQAESLDMALPMLLPGIRIKTGPDDHAPVEQMQFVKFNGEKWEIDGKMYGR